MKTVGQAFYADLAILILHVDHVEGNVKIKINLHSGSIIFTLARRKRFLPGGFTNNLEIYKEERKNNKNIRVVCILSFLSLLLSLLQLCVCFKPRKQKTSSEDEINPFCLWQKSGAHF